MSQTNIDERGRERIEREGESGRDGGRREKMSQTKGR
jgi:hypothetical protein